MNDISPYRIEKERQQINKFVYLVTGAMLFLLSGLMIIVYFITFFR